MKSLLLLIIFVISKDFKQVNCVVFLYCFYLLTVKLKNINKYNFYFLSVFVVSFLLFWFKDCTEFCCWNFTSNENVSFSGRQKIIHTLDSHLCLDVVQILQQHRPADRGEPDCRRETSATSRPCWGSCRRCRDCGRSR